MEKVPDPICPQGGVLVEVKACGICTSDVKMAQKGHRALEYPRILGHEVSGIVKESKNKAFKEGDRVQLAPGLK
ncbi:MAG: alcohol dehydrogenase catalytic domain-containing protein [Deltaproteobacteria bacterium]|nr:alcohol dehydrogenase catalytic domain-containing protein [Deltaproteobacteria bacterium]